MGSGITGLSWESFCLPLLHAFGLQQSKSVILFQNSVQFEVSKKNPKIKPLSLLKTDTSTQLCFSDVLRLHGTS